MAQLTYAQVYALARAAGLTHEQAITATAITDGESGRDPGKVGDQSLADAKWGPSVGLWQIRTLRAETGTGGTRDINRLKDPTFNARSMFAESEHGTNWRPWTVYKSGEYVSSIPAVRAAVGNGTGAAGTAQTGVTSPSGVTVQTGRSPFDIDLSLGPLSGPLEGLVNAAGPLLLAGALLAGGVALVVVGVYGASK
jgi:hypothetical protein